MVKPDHSDHLSTIDGDIFVNSFDGLFFGGGVFSTTFSEFGAECLCIVFLKTLHIQ